MNAELPALVRAAQNGDKEAFGQIVGRFQDMAFASAYALLGNAMLAQDAAQDAFVDAFRTLHLLAEPAAFPGWFRRIIFKHSDRQVRGKQLTLAPLEAAYDVRSPQPGPHDLLEEALLRQDVDGAIQLLPANQRMVVSLFYIEGYSQAEIADFLEIPVTAVKKRLFNARNNLRERMITMVQETLQANRPSQSDEFVDKVSFYIALRANDLDRVTSLIDSDPSLATMTIDRCEGIPAYYWPIGVTPLNWAAGTGNLPLVDLLLAHGADINAQPKANSMTPLHEAINMHQTDLASAMLERSANVNATAHGGQTPLHYAIHKNNPQAAELLLKAGAQVDARDASGRTAIDWAVAYDRPILVELLTAHGAAKPKAYKATRRAEKAPTAGGRSVPVGSAVMGRVLNGKGEAVDGGSLVEAASASIYRPARRPGAHFNHRYQNYRPLRTYQALTAIMRSLPPALVWAKWWCWASWCRVWWRSTAAVRSALGSTAAALPVKA
ncbi:MAG: sigma-70 family RNA polymerase sigma factor [Caldilineaceae bacterium]